MGDKRKEAAPRVYVGVRDLFRASGILKIERKFVPAFEIQDGLLCVDFSGLPEAEDKEVKQKKKGKKG